jgi:glycosyltransferase involved in cell wall biosynthesis
MVSPISVAKPPQLTIAIPCFNEEIGLRELLRDIQIQGYVDFNAVVYDNASTDSTHSLVQAFAKNDSRFVLHTNTRNLGLLENFRQALKYCQTPYFIWLGAHDRINSSYLEQLVEVLSNDAEIALVYGAIKDSMSEGNSRTDVEDNGSLYVSNFDTMKNNRSLSRYFEYIGESRSHTARMHGVFRTEMLKPISDFKWKTGGIDHVILSRASFFGSQFVRGPIYFRFHRNPKNHIEHKLNSSKRFFLVGSIRYYYPTQTFVPLICAFVKDFFKFPIPFIVKLLLAPRLIFLIRSRFEIRIVRNLVRHILNIFYATRERRRDENSYVRP